jgi:hypothetical protein
MIAIAAIAIMIYGGVTLAGHKILLPNTMIPVTTTTTPIIPDTEKNCFVYKTKHTLMIGTTKTPIGGCRWLEDKLLSNGSKWQLTGYGILPHVRSLSGDDIPALERFVLTKP